ncbi:hypothetical protein JCM15765_14990 [Paradesulfitobacterium aromaticivorans]
MAGLAGRKMPNRYTKNSVSKATTQCKCLSCAKPMRDTMDGLNVLICGGEACFLNCERCTERPHGCEYKPRVGMVS